MADETPNWHETLPDEFKTHPTLKPHIGKPLDGLVKSYVEAQRMVGSALKVPGEMATAEERSAFYAKLGRPEAADKYELKDPKELPDGVKLSDEFRAAYRKQAFEAGMTPAQAQAAWGFFVEQSVGAQTAHQAAQVERVKQTGEALRKEWGGEFDAKVKLVNQGAALFGDKLQEQVLAMAAGNPDFAKALADIGGKVSEDTTSKSGGGGGDMTAEQATAKIAEIRADPNHAYHSKLKPGHKEAVDEMQRLYEIKTGVAKKQAA